MRSSCATRNSSALLLLTSPVDIKVRTNVAVELRDNIEPLCSGSNYPIFLARLWPVFKNILKGDPVFTNMSFEQVSEGPGIFSHTVRRARDSDEMGLPVETAKLHSRDSSPVADGLP